MRRYSKYQNTDNWFGIIPATWEIHRIKRLFALRDKRNFLPLEQVNLISLYSNVGVRQHCDIEHTTGNRARNADGYKVVHKDDIIVNILLCWMGAIGRSNYDGVTSPAYDVYMPRTNINSQYYHYLFRTKAFSGECYKVGKGIMAMRWRTYSPQFMNINVPEPPRAEQDQIVRFLDWKVSEINKLTGIRKKQIKQLEEIKEKQIENALSHFSCKADVQPLKAIAYCNRESLSESTAENYSFRYIDIGSVDEKEGITHYEEMKFKNAPSRARRIVHKNDIIISTVRTYLKAIARITDDKDVIVSTRFAVLSPHGVDSKYLEYYFKSKRFCDEVIRESIGIAYPAIDTSKLMRIKILVPRYEEQLAITAQVHKNEILINQTISLLKRKIKQLQELKSTLISDVVTGKIDVRNIPVPAYEHVEDMGDDAGEGNEENAGIPGEED